MNEPGTSEAAWRALARDVPGLAWLLVAGAVIEAVFVDTIVADRLTGAMNHAIRVRLAWILFLALLLVIDLAALGMQIVSALDTAGCPRASEGGQTGLMRRRAWPLARGGGGGGGVPRARRCHRVRNRRPAYEPQDSVRPHLWFPASSWTNVAAWGQKAWRSTGVCERTCHGLGARSPCGTSSTAPHVAAPGEFASF